MTISWFLLLIHHLRRAIECRIKEVKPGHCARQKQFSRRSLRRTCEQNAARVLCNCVPKRTSSDSLRSVLSQ